MARNDALLHERTLPFGLPDDMARADEQPVKKK